MASTSKAYVASEICQYGDVGGGGGGTRGGERGVGSPLTEYGCTVHTVLALLARLLLCVELYLSFSCHL